jgi:hypothetical protein
LLRNCMCIAPLQGIATMPHPLWKHCSWWWTSLIVPIFHLFSVPWTVYFLPILRLVQSGRWGEDGQMMRWVGLQKWRELTKGLLLLSGVGFRVGTAFYYLWPFFLFSFFVLGKSLHRVSRVFSFQQGSQRSYGTFLPV